MSIPYNRIRTGFIAKKYRVMILMGSILGAPLTVFGATALDPIFTSIEGAFTTIITILFALATLAFIWGVIQYIISKGPDEQAKAKTLMLWGIIALAVMAAMWGFARILVNFFGAGGTAIPQNLNTPFTP